MLAASESVEGLLLRLSSYHLGLLLATLAACGFAAKAIFAKMAYRYGVDGVTLVTLRLLDGQPLSLIRHRFCISLAPLLADYQGGSLRQYLAERDLPLTRTFSLIGARLPSREEAAHLLMPRHAPLLSVLTLSRDPAGRAVELAQSSSRADRFQYQVAT